MSSCSQGRARYRQNGWNGHSVFGNTHLYSLFLLLHPQPRGRGKRVLVIPLRECLISRNCCSRWVFFDTHAIACCFCKIANNPRAHPATFNQVLTRILAFLYALPPPALTTTRKDEEGPCYTFKRVSHQLAWSSACPTASTLALRSASSRRNWSGFLRSR